MADSRARIGGGSDVHRGDHSARGLWARLSPRWKAGPTLAGVTARVRPASDVAEYEDDEPGGLIVEHYRLDPTRALGRALGWASAIVTIGGLVMAAAILIPRLDPNGPMASRAVRTTAADAMFRSGEVTVDGTPIERSTLGLELALGFFGIGCIVAGGAAAIIGLRRVLSEESYLALRTDGAYFRTASERSLVRWEDVESVRWDAATRSVLFERHDGTAWIRREAFAGIDGEELAKRAGDVRRKALFGLIRFRR
jgi:hypothetical protein